MAIRFRCDHCRTLMSIASRKAGTIVRCAACDAQVRVPDESSLEPAPAEPAPAEPPRAEARPPAVAAEPADAQAAPEEDRIALPDDLFDFDDEPARSAAADADDPAVEFAAFNLADYYADAPAVSPAGAAEPLLAGDEPSQRPPRPPATEADRERFTVQLRKSSIDDEMDLTPMVDVVFQLLIFFMVTASFALHKTIQTPTPESNQKGATQSIQSLDELEGVAILVRIDANNGIVIDDDPLADDSRVADALKDKMRKEHKSEIIITADSAAWHRTVVKVVDAANEVGMQKIRLATRSGGAE